MHQSTSVVSARDYVQLIDNAPIETLPKSIVEQLDAMLCAATLVRRRITEHVPVEPTEIDMEKFDRDDMKILKGFATYPCGRKAIKEYG